ncbi:PLP-dependent aminotransferase family protein [bacterium]|nr:PLP-dependent aminotransferase family protein [bacterium]
MDLKILLDKDSQTPLYLQIYEQIVSLVRDGLLAPGERISSVRNLAKDLDVSVTTVFNAYDMLAAENIIERRSGSGTYITEHPEIVLGSNLRTREETIAAQQNRIPLEWDKLTNPFEYFGMPRSRKYGSSVISFSHLYPEPSLFPFDRIKQVATSMLWNPQEFFFDIGHPQGYQPLVEHLEKEMALNGVAMAEGENDIIISGGFRRALGLVLSMILKPGQKVAIEAPTYNGIINCLSVQGIGIVQVDLDEQGIRTDLLERELEAGNIGAIVVTPTYHNPTGITMSMDRRTSLLDLAERFKLPIIEDDYGRQLRYEGKAPLPLKAMDSGNYVIHIGTFAKSFLPGIRVGWLCAPSSLAYDIVAAKLGRDSGDSYFLQVLLHEFIQRGYYSKHVRHAAREYRKRRNVMDRVLREHLPEGCSYEIPNGGFAFWIKLPAGIRGIALLSMSRRAGVDFTPGAFFMPDHSDINALRLSFSRTATSEIEKGVRILCEQIGKAIADPALLKREASSFKDLYE